MDEQGPTDLSPADDVDDEIAQTKPSGREETQHPSHIARFSVLRELGRGGMGIVYSGYDEELDRRVALKVLRKSGDKATARMRREAQAMAKLSHPNVAQIYEVGTWEGQLYLAIEFVKGVTLKAWLAECERSVDEVLSVMRQAGEGLAAAHDAGLVHRDFKPDNVMVGEDGRVRVLDFGLAGSDSMSEGEMRVERDDAPQADESPFDTPLTRTGALMGTPAYMSAEQFAGKTVSAASDQFSFCATLYEALYGERPFAGNNLMTIGVAVAKGQVRQAPSASRVPPALRAVVVKGLAVDNGDRHAGMRDLLDALSPKAPRRTAMWALGAALVASLGAVAWFASAEPESRTAERDLEAERRAAIVAASSLPEPLDAPLEADKSGTTIHRLDNGLTVYITPEKTSPKLDAKILVRVGENDEREGEAGAVDLLGELLRNGSARLGTRDHDAEQAALTELRTLWVELENAKGTERERLLEEIAEKSDAAEKLGMPDEIERVFDGLGISPHRSYSLVNHLEIAGFVPSNRLASWLEIMAETLREPSFRDARGDALRMATDATAMDLGQTPAWGPIWEGHPYAGARSRSEGLQLLPVATAMRLYDQYVAPNNVAIALRGDVDWVTAKPLIEASFGDWEPRELPAHPRISPAPTIEGRTEIDTDPNRKQLELFWPGPADGHQDQVVFTVLQRLVNDEVVGTANAERPANSRIKGARSSYVPVADRGEWSLKCTPVADAANDAVEQGCLDVLTPLREGTFAQEDFDAVKRALTVTPPPVWSVVKAPALNFGDGVPWPVAVSRYERLHQVTREDVVAVAKEWLGPDFLVRLPGAGDGQRPEPPELLPAPEEPSSAGEFSERGRELLAREAVPLEPQFLLQGKDFEVVSSAAGPLVSAETSGDTTKSGLRILGHQLGVGDCEAFRMVLEVGSRSHPGAEFQRALHRQGAQLDVFCLGTLLRVNLEAPNETHDAAWALLEEAVLSPNDDAAIIAQAAEADLSEDSKPLFMRTKFEFEGARGMAASKRVEQAIAQATAEEHARRLARVAATPRITVYAGPNPPSRSYLWAGDGAAERTARSPATPQPPERPRVHLLHDDSLGSQIIVTVAWTLPIGDERRRWQRDLLSRVWRQRAEPLRVRYTHGWMVMVVPRLTTRPAFQSQFFVQKAVANRENVVAKLQAVMERSIQIPEAQHVSEVLQGLERELRIHRYEPEYIPETVAKWMEQDPEFAGDPRQREWVWMLKAGPEDLEPVIRELADTPPNIALVGDTKGLDEGALRQLGEVVRLDPADFE